jgi:hypothetical protein
MSSKRRTRVGINGLRRGRQASVSQRDVPIKTPDLEMKILLTVMSVKNNPVDTIPCFHRANVFCFAAFVRLQGYP